MDSWQAVQNWAIFGLVAGGLGWYYYPKNKKVEKPQEKAKIREQPAAPKQAKQHSKRSDKPNAKVAFAAAPTPAPAAKSEAGQNASEDSALSFAEEMMKARKGTTLKTADKADSRVKTVKQGSALRDSATSSGVQPQQPIVVATSTANAGSVDDMLEPTAPGPASLRIAPAQQPVHERAPKAAKKEVVESKKQRQNRQKKEAAKQQRDEEEQARKALEEKQRRSAREARGEPAKNGIPVSKPPANNAWSESNGGSSVVKQTAETANAPAPLLDTFDVESTSSSNAGASTAATSTTEGHQAQWMEDLPTEEEQMAAIRAQDNSWSEVKSSKKQKKKPASSDSTGTSTPLPAPAAASKPAAPAKKPLVNGKPIGFQALRDELDDSAGGDPNDASSWAA